MCISRSDSEQRLHLKQQQKQQQQQAMGAMGSMGAVPATPLQEQHCGKSSQAEQQAEQQALFEETAQVRDILTTSAVLLPSPARARGARAHCSLPHACFP